MRSFILAGCLILAPMAAFALEVQLGVANNSVVFEDNYYEDSSFMMPYVAVGTEISDGILLFLEGSQHSLDITEKLNGDDVADFKIAGTGIAIVVVPRFERIDLRLGYGQVTYTYDYAPTSAGRTYLSDLGITNYETTLDQDKGTQIFYGLDFFVTDSILLGIEHREIETKISTKTTFDYGGQSYSESGTDNINFAWTGARLTVAFSGGR